MIDRIKIGHGQHVPQRRNLLVKLWPVANMLPQAARAVADIAILQQSILRPTNDRRDQQTGEAKIIIGLQHEFDRGQQILHHQRLQQPKPVDACNRHIALMQLRHQHRRHVATAAQQEHDIAGFKRAIFANQPRFRVDQSLDMIRQFFG